MKKKKSADELLNIGGFDFRLEKTAKGWHVTHYLYRSVKGGYLISLTNLDLELDDYKKTNRGNKKRWIK